MEITLDPQKIIPWLTVLSSLFYFFNKIFKAVSRARSELDSISKCQAQIYETVEESKKLNRELVKASLASLIGHIEHGANGPVKAAKKELEEFIKNDDEICLIHVGGNNNGDKQ